MKALQIISIFILIVSTSISSSAQSAENTNPTMKKSEDVQVYYFHNARRCATCKSVEAEAKKAVEEIYDGKVSFAAYNLEEADGKQKAEELDVSGQSLLIVGGDTKIDITNEGFMYARNNPEKLKRIIKEKTDPLL